MATRARSAVLAREASIARHQKQGTLSEQTEHSDEFGDSTDELFRLEYDELRELARGFLLKERPGHTLQPTALVHEMYLKLAYQTRMHWKSRTHFVAVGALVMKQLLIDHARKRGAQKRGGEWRRVTLSGNALLTDEQTISMENLLALNACLDRLAAINKRSAQVVVLRLFGGLSSAEVADVVGVTRRTVSSDWRHALAWLRRELHGSCDS